MSTLSSNFWINIWTRFKFECFTLWDFIRTASRFYSNPLFRKVDCALLVSYFGKNPYRISRHFLESRGAKEIYAYGETPLAAMEKIAQQCRLSEKDTIYELGSGRGRVCFWLALNLKARVIGIDIVPTFIEKARKIANRFNLNNPVFQCSDFLQSDLQDCTALYLNGVCMEEEEILRLIKKLEKLPSGVKIITVSFTLREYSSSGRFQPVKEFLAPFAWGDVLVYLVQLK